MERKLLSVTVTQIETKDITSIDKYVEKITSIVKKAKSDGSNLVLLPQHTGPLIDGFNYGFKSFKELVEGKKDDKTFLDIHSRIAEENDIYICPGTNIEIEKGRIYNCGYLISNKGRVVLRQKQTHLTKTERELGFSRGVEIDIAETLIGKIGLVIGTDKYYPEVSRIVALMGADIALNPSGFSEEYSLFRQIAGMWEEVQQNQFYGLESSFIGSILDKNIDGRCSIFAPCEITEGFTGFLTPIEKGEHFKISTLDIEELNKPRTQFPIFDHLNVPLYKRVFPRIYRGVR